MNERVTLNKAAMAAAQEKQAERRVLAARSRLLRDARFWGVQAMRLKVRPMPPEMAAACPGSPAATDGEVFYYNAGAIGRFKDSELVFIWAHETAHCAALHPLRMAGRERMRWNIAADYAVNPLIQESGFTAPSGVLIDEAWKGPGGWMSAETIYSKLPAGQEQPAKAVMLGEVLPWKPGGADGKGDKDGDAPMTAKELERGWREAVAEAATISRAAGKLPGALEDFSSRVMQPSVPWQDVLAAFLRRAEEDYSFARINRRFIHAGLAIPALHSEDRVNLALGVDTSGSVSDEQVNLMLAEMGAILAQLPAARLKVFFHTSEVYETAEFDASNPPSLKRAQRGGTDFRPVFALVEEDGAPPDALVMLTDLDGPTPHDPPSYPVLWVSCGLREAPFGEVVMMEG